MIPQWLPPALLALAMLGLAFLTQVTSGFWMWAIMAGVWLALACLLSWFLSLHYRRQNQLDEASRQAYQRMIHRRSQKSSSGYVTQGGPTAPKPYESPDVKVAQTTTRVSVPMQAPSRSHLCMPGGSHYGAGITGQTGTTTTRTASLPSASTASPGGVRGPTVDTAELVGDE